MWTRIARLGGNREGIARLELLPWAALMEVAKVYDYGATKYAPNNWRKGMAWGRMTGALMRHMTACVVRSTRRSRIP